MRSYVAFLRKELHHQMQLFKLEPNEQRQRVIELKMHDIRSLLITFISMGWTQRSS